jgi:hypothetical protein
MEVALMGKIDAVESSLFSGTFMGRANWKMFMVLTCASIALQLFIIVVNIIEPHGDFFYSNGFRFLELTLIVLAGIAVCLATVICINNLSKMRVMYRVSFPLAIVMIVYSALSILLFFLIRGTWGFSA